MYEFVTHTHNHIGGECPHRCNYCYVNNPRFGRPEKYTGPLRLIEKEFSVNYGEGKTIFMENCNDAFSDKVPIEWIVRIINHANMFPKNSYVWQTKNPAKYMELGTDRFHENSLFGTTIETNRELSFISKAPPMISRISAMERINRKTFLTIEPICDFDLSIMIDWIESVNPSFINIGADSKNHGLPEPSWDKVQLLINGIKELGIEIKEKHNLERLKNVAPF